MKRKTALPILKSTQRQTRNGAGFSQIKRAVTQAATQKDYDSFDRLSDNNPTWLRYPGGVGQKLNTLQL